MRTHYTKHKKKGKKLVEKERQKKKAKYASIKQRKARKSIILVNVQLIFSKKNRLQTFFSKRNVYGRLSSKNHNQ